MYVPPWQRRRTPKAPTPPRRNASLEVLGGEFEEKEFGFGGGEMIAAPLGPAPTPPAPFEIPPPPWHGLPAVAPLEQPAAPPMSAVQAMMAEARERGELGEPDYEPGPPPHFEPLDRSLTLPVPDWAAEEKHWATVTRQAKVDQALKLINEELR